MTKATSTTGTRRQMNADRIPVRHVRNLGCILLDRHTGDHLWETAEFGRGRERKTRNCRRHDFRQ